MNEDELEKLKIQDTVWVKARLMTKIQDNPREIYVLFGGIAFRVSIENVKLLDRLHVEELCRCGTCKHRETEMCIYAGCGCCK